MIIYADFESLIKPRDDSQHQRVLNNHVALSVGFYIKYSFDDSLSEYKSYRQLSETMKTPTDWLIENFKEIAIKVEAIYDNIQPMNISKEEEENFQTADTCHICNKKFLENEFKIHDHDHITSRYVKNIIIVLFI